MADIKSVCVYCGSSPGNDPLYVEEARRFGQILAHEGVRLVYGGGGIGLMGEVAGAAARAGGAVTGIIPDFLQNREMRFPHEAEMIVVADMHERKRLMFEQADAFVALPGGVGTLEELVEQLTWAQLDRHRKPVLLANTAGFWSPFLDLLTHMRATGFVGPSRPVRIHTAERPEDILPTLRKAAADMTERDLHALDELVAGQM